MSIFANPEASINQVTEAGEIFRLSVYGGNKPNSLDKHRFYAYKRAVAKMSVKSKFHLSTLPPTTDAARLHSVRVLQQVKN